MYYRTVYNSQEYIYTTVLYIIVRNIYIYYRTVYNSQEYILYNKLTLVDRYKLKNSLK